MTATHWILVGLIGLGGRLAVSGSAAAQQPNAGGYADAVASGRTGVLRLPGAIPIEAVFRPSQGSRRSEQSG